MDVKEKRMRYWILMMCYVNRKYGGVQVDEMFGHKRKEIALTLPQFIAKINDLEKEGVLRQDIKPGHLNPFYVLSEKGNKEINNLMRKQDYEFHRVLLLLPPEYELRWRIFGIERFILYTSLSFGFYSSSMVFIKFGFVLTGLLLMTGTFFFLPFATAYLGRIASFILTGFLTNLFGKTYSFLDRKSKVLSCIISTCLIIIALAISYFVSLWSFLAVIVSILVGFVFKDYFQRFIQTKEIINNLLQKIKPFFKIY